MITVSVNGSANLVARLTLLTKVMNVPEILDESAALLLNVMKQRYQAEKDPDNVSWVPSMAALKERRKTLIRTGRLFHSIQLYRESENERAIGTNVSYGRMHQEGLGVLRRSFLGFNDGDAVLVAEFLKKRLKNAGV